MAGIHKGVANTEREIEVLRMLALAYNLFLSKEQALHIAFRQL